MAKLTSAPESDLLLARVSRELGLRSPWFQAWHRQQLYWSLVVPSLLLINYPRYRQYSRMLFKASFDRGSLLETAFPDMLFHLEDSFKMITRSFRITSLDPGNVPLIPFTSDYI